MLINVVGTEVTVLSYKKTRSFYRDKSNEYCNLLMSIWNEQTQSFVTFNSIVIFARSEKPLCNVATGLGFERNITLRYDTGITRV